MQTTIDALLQESTESGQLQAVVAAVTNSQGTLYTGASNAAAHSPVNADSVFTIHSMTKAVTAVAAMQMVEQGLLNLDDPAGNICPELRDIQVLEGFDADGAPKLRAPARPVTLRHLLTHTSGFVYEFWNEKFGRYIAASGTPSLLSQQKAALRVPLMFDPGDRWEYGIGIDWVGLMIEAVSGLSLGEYFDNNVTGPLGMVDTAFTATEAMAERMLSIYQRLDDGTLAIPADEEEEALTASPPEFELGGGGLLSTPTDYLRFMRMILRSGELDGMRVLAPETVDMMATNQMCDLRVTELKTAQPEFSNDAEFFPGSPKSWGLSFQINEEACFTGRPEGTLMWAGLANMFFWIDRENDIGGLLMTQLLPFVDDICVELLYAMETAVYDSIRQKSLA